MTLARASDGFAGGGWRCLVRFGFVSGNFVRRSMSIFAVMMFVVPRRVAAPDADTDRTANRFQNICDSVRGARRRHRSCAR